MWTWQAESQRGGRACWRRAAGRGGLRGGWGGVVVGVRGLLSLRAHRTLAGGAPPPPPATLPPVAHLSPGHPSSPESTCPARNICHSCTNICLSRRPAYLFPPYICISRISVSAKYLSQSNVFIYHIFVSRSRCLSRSLTSPDFVSL